jgi:hypothetical protein
MSVYCSDCDNVCQEGLHKDKPWEWRCIAYPTEPGFGFVTPDYSPNPPYARCVDANRYGDCPSYEPKRNLTK